MAHHNIDRFGSSIDPNTSKIIFRPKFGRTVLSPKNADYVVELNTQSIFNIVIKPIASRVNRAPVAMPLRSAGS